MKKSWLKIGAVITGMIFFGVLFFGFGASLTQSHDGAMSDCPLMSDQAVACPMSIADHITFWQRLFSSSAENFSFARWMAIFVAFFAVVIPVVFRILDDIHSPPRAFFARIQSLSKIFHELFRAFSRGILHGKIFQ